MKIDRNQPSLFSAPSQFSGDTVRLTLNNGLVSCCDRFHGYLITHIQCILLTLDAGSHAKGVKSIIFC